MFKKFWVWLSGPQVKKPRMDLRGAMMHIGTDPVEEAHKHNAEEYARAQLDLQYDALQKNLTIMHYTMLAAFIAILVSMVIGIFAIRDKPNVTVRPNITVKVEK